MDISTTHFSKLTPGILIKKIERFTFYLLSIAYPCASSKSKITNSVERSTSKCCPFGSPEEQLGYNRQSLYKG